MGRKRLSHGRWLLGRLLAGYKVSPIQAFKRHNMSPCSFNREIMTIRENPPRGTQLHQEYFSERITGGRYKRHWLVLEPTPKKKRSRKKQVKRVSR